MNKLKLFLLKNPLLVIFVISLITRLFWLKFGMPSVTDDEVDIYNSSYILARTGKDFFGNTFFLTTGILTPKPSVPIWIGMTPWLFTGIKSVFLARLPFTVLNSFTPLLLYYIVEKITNRKPFALLAFLIINFSPWFSYISVTGYEATVALFFVLLFFSFLLSTITIKTKILLSTVVAFLMFNSYMGIKPIFPFIIFIGGLLFLNTQKIKTTLKTYTLLTCLSISIFGIFVGLNYIAPNSDLIKKEYGYMIQYYEKQKMDGMVWFERYTTTGPTPLKIFIANKFTIRLRDYLSKYMLSFNPQIFFQKGDPSSLYGTADLSGLFFITDFIFFVWGVLYIRTIKEKGLKILISLLFIGGVSVAVSTGSTTFILRGIVLIIPYTLLIAHGLTLALTKMKNKKIGYMAVGLLLSINFLLYFITFNMRIVNLNAEQWRYSFQKMDEKLPLLKKNFKKIIVYNPERREFFFQYAFYNINNSKTITNHMKDEDYAFENMQIVTNCPLKPPAPNELFVINTEFCPIDTTLKTIKIVEVFKSRNMSGKDYYAYMDNSLVENKVGSSK